MSRILTAFLVLVAAWSSALSQSPIWKNLSSMYNVNGVTASDGKVWAATSGGVFSFAPATSSFVEYTTTEGLSDIQATAIVSEPGGDIIVGEIDGSVDELDSTGKVVRSQRDIAKSSAILRQIVSLSVEGDTLFACTPFGVVLISRSSFGVLDTYSHFYTQSVQANDATIYDGSIFVANQFGLSYASRSAVNLAAPDLWKLADTLGLRRGVNAVKAFEGSLYVGTNGGLFSTADGRSFKPVAGSPSGAVYGIASGSNYLLINSASGIYKMSPGGLFATLYTGGTAINGLADYSDTLVVAATSRGLLKIGVTTTSVLPPGPATNSVSDVGVDSLGNLWCSTNRTSDVGIALMRFDGESWTNFSMSTNPQLSTNNYYKISPVGGNQIIAGAWGGPSGTYRGGVALIEGDSIKEYSTPNSTLVGEPGDATYVLGGGAAPDQAGNIWITNPYSYTNSPIVAYSRAENKWYSFRNYLSPVSGYVPIAVDAYGGVWAGDQYGVASSTSYSGLLYFNANGTLSNTSDDQSYIFNQGNSSILSNHVNSVITDNEDQVWIGTDLGLDVVYDPDPSGSLSIQSIYSLLDQNINDIAYDALDQKWVATNTGVYVISRDGNSTVASYNMTNSPLPSNEVIAVACDRQRGIVYFATQYGVTELKTGVEQPLQNFSKLKVYPDPAKIPLNNPIHIEGLAANSEIKIFTIDGRLVDHFLAQGGYVAYWNGTDQTGKLLPTGVYIIVAYSSDGSQSVVGKIALIHQ
jgi:ligand-binding sensor domain-containing protein